MFTLIHPPPPKSQDKQVHATMTYGSRPLEYQINIDQTDMSTS